jgi:lipopolysaccharide biosynthesis protein
VEEAPRLVAFYLPQFHPIPENDAWWGEGFTEWTNVAKAKPLFDGHYQPHIPADLGFYDLRLPETRLAQAELAREYGISAFCYYHYWFNGSRLLNRPFDEVLASGEPDFPFALCWANEPWSRRWNGRPDDVLQAQAYSRKDDLAHIRWLLPALADPRALTIEDRPVFVVYQARDLPDPARTVETWRREVTRAGVPDPYLLTVETGWDEGWDATEVGFDAKIMFRPQFTTLREASRLRVPAHPDLEVRSYEAAWPLLARPEDVPYPTFETVCPQWDNSARTGGQGVVLHDSTPEAYEQWLHDVLARTMERPPEQRLVFVNAWNEWGEGCHLEPDRRWGLAYLEATRRALMRVAGGGSPGDVAADLLAALLVEDS